MLFQESQFRKDARERLQEAQGGGSRREMLNFDFVSTS
jgi:hypothetical protein